MRFLPRIFSFNDGLSSLTSDLVNRRKASATNKLTTTKLSDTYLRTIFRLGIASKIYRIKSGYALNGTLDFESVADQTFYETHLAAQVKRACMQQLGFGRGAMLVAARGDDLSKPRANTLTPENTVIRAFSGDLVSAITTSFDIEDERYYKPSIYNIRGNSVHWTRVVDFTYYEPSEQDLPTYNYGGISEAELIYEQLVNDGVIERASASIVEKNSTLFYKMKGFKSRLAAKKEAEMLQYMATLETARSMYGAGLLDAEDSVEEVSQTLTNLEGVNESSLRRLAMITGIPLPMLVGESVKGLNSTGDTERQTFEDTIANYANDYVVPNINTLMYKFGRGPVEFKGLQDNSALQRATYEGLVLDNAIKFQGLGGDFSAYLEQHKLIEKEPTDSAFDDLRF